MRDSGHAAAYGGQSTEVSGSSDVTVLVHGTKTIADRAFPPVEALGEVVAAPGACLTELSGEDGKGTPALAFGLRLELGEEPAAGP